MLERKYPENHMYWYFNIATTTISSSSCDYTASEEVTRRVKEELLKKAAHMRACKVNRKDVQESNKGFLKNAKTKADFSYWESKIKKCHGSFEAILEKWNNPEIDICVTDTTQKKLVEDARAHLLNKIFERDQEKTAVPASTTAPPQE